MCQLAIDTSADKLRDACVQVAEELEALTKLAPLDGPREREG